MQKTVKHPKFPALSEGVTDLKDTEGGVSRMCDVMERYKEAAVKEAAKKATERTTRETKDRMHKVALRLKAENRNDDIARAALEPEYLEQLFIEFEL